MGSIAVNITSRGLSSVHNGRSTMFQRRTALLVAILDATAPKPERVEPKQRLTYYLDLFP